MPDGLSSFGCKYIDSEYEWMKMGAKTKVKFSHKHTAEHNFDQDIEFIDDETYNSQILVDLSKEKYERFNKCYSTSL